MCFFGGGCGSDEYCCPWLFFGTIGNCGACCADPQCLSQNRHQPPAGEFGNPLCIDNKCQAFANGEFSQIPEEGYPLWIPSETLDQSHEFHKIVLPREVYSQVDPKPIMEQVWYFDFNDQDSSFEKEKIKYNGTHLEIPSYEAIHAGYSRSYNHFDEHETGIVTLISGDNTYSIVADYPRAAFVEKYHTLTYSGIKDTSRGDYMKTKSDEGMKKPFNRKKWFQRSFFQVTYLLLVDVYSQLEAGIDHAIAWQVRRYVNSYPKTDIGKVSPKTSSSWASHSEQAQEAIKNAKDPNFVREFNKSEQHCKHFEDMQGVMEHTDTTVTYPLGQPITVFSGEMVNSPIYYLGLAAGHATFHYDEDKNVLQIFCQTFSHSRQYSDVKFPGPYPSGVHVSPVSEGPDYAVDADKDGRTDGMLLLDQPKGMGPFSRRIPADFTLWSRPRDEVCDSKWEDSSFWTDIDIAEAELGANSIFEYLLQAKHVLKGVIGGMPCANVWMRSDYGRGTNAFGINEIGVWIHALGEIPDHKTKEMGLAKFWDSWECFYRNKDPALCSED